MFAVYTTELNVSKYLRGFGIKTRTSFFLQETHSTEHCEKAWKEDWGNDAVFFSHGLSNSRGVCILIKDLSQITITRQYRDDYGRLLVLDTDVSNTKITFINVYGPNIDDSPFFDNISQILGNFDCESIVWGGDFNCVLDLNLDKKGGRHVTHGNSVKCIYDIMDEYNLVDVWRFQNPNLSRFTWHLGDAFCRLDFFLISNNLVVQTEKCTISPGFKTDHSAICLYLTPVNEIRGRGFWKFNTSLLNDKIFVELIRNCIAENKLHYSNSLDPNTFWDFLKCQMRSLSIYYSINKAKEHKTYEKNLIEKLNKLEESYDNHPSDSLLDMIKQCKEDLELLYQRKTDGAIIRSKSNWIEKGEKSTRYFLNLEKRNQRQKLITKIYNEKGEMVEGTKPIIHTIKEYYESMFCSCDLPVVCFDDILPQECETYKLSVNESNQCEGLITMKELMDTLKTMKNNKTPGTDGFPCEFYKFFFKDLGEILLQSFNFSFQSGKMSLEQRRAIINLIPKKSQDLLYLKNWRPISVLNTDYKLLTKCLAQRLKKVLDEIISSDQTGFIKGRYIGENIRIALDMIDYTNFNNTPGFMLLADIEKAFDKLEWSYMFQVLKFFNFGESFMKWIRVIYTDIYSCVINNGHASEFFNITRGIRQGCPLSPLLFVICHELMSITIKGDPDIQGIMINDVEIKISMYADDTTFYVNDVKSLTRIVHILDNLKAYSGLYINRNKSEIIALGYYKAHPPDINIAGLKYSNGPFNLLGIQFTYDVKDFCKLNYVPKLEKLKRTLKVWSQRDLTPLGKITIVKCLGISQLIFLLSVLPKPPESFLQELESIIFSFIWDKKPDKINRKTIIGDYETGGLKMLHIRSIIMGLKIAWIKRFLNDDNKGKWKCFLRLFMKSLGGDLFWYCNVKSNEKCLLVNNTFLREILQSWCELSFNENPPQEFIHNQILWNNSCIKVNGSLVFKKDWINKGINRINHLLKHNGNFLTYSEFIDKFELHCNFLDYYSLLSAIPLKWKYICKEPPAKDVNYQEETIYNIKKVTKICKLIHKMYVDKIFITPISQRKWEGIVADPLFNWRKIYIIPFKCTLSTKLRYFQYKLIHNILGVNKYLKQVGISNSDLCTFCSVYTETIVHLFWECPFTRRFLDDFEKLILKNEIKLTFNDFIFGIPGGNYSSFNFVILYAKYYIFSTKCLNGFLSMSSFQKKLKYQKELEESMNMQQDKFILYHDGQRPIQLI